MDRNRESRRVTMAASANGLSRRRHRSNSLRDSPEEDGPVELHEPARLRDRGVKKDRDRERDRLSRSKRRRNREDGGDDSSEDSVNDEDDEDDDEAAAGAVRMLPPNPAVAMTNHHHLNRKSFPPSAPATKVFRPVQGWKPADEMIGFSVPRKARSASTKRSHECWISASGAGAEQIHRQASPSPSSAPLSPSSSNVPLRKKMKPNGPKQKPPKSSSKASSSNPEELEIEIAEVLYGLMTQSQGPSKKEIDSAKFDSNRHSGDSKSRVSSPISNSASPVPQSSSILPQNSSSTTAPLSAVAPKRKKPRQVSDNLGSFSARNSSVSSTTVKLEMDQPPKTENSSPILDKNPVSAAENGVFPSIPFNFSGSQGVVPPSEFSLPPDVGLETPAKEAAASSPKKEAPMVKPEDNQDDAPRPKVNSISSEMEIQREEKFEIDLMASPPHQRLSPERGSDMDFASAAEQKPVVSEPHVEMKLMTEDKDEDKVQKSGKDEMIVEEPELKKVKATTEAAESEKPVVNKETRIIDLQLDLEKPERDNSESLLPGNKSHAHVQKQQQPQLKVAKDEQPHSEKTALSSSLPLPMSLASWPGGLPPMGYMAPLQGVVSLDGSQVPSNPMQPLFSQPRPKRCATHCYIARNIHYLQQFMKMNPFWSAAAGSASMFGAKPCNLNVVPSAELHGRATVNSVHDKGQGLAIFPGHTGNDKASQPATIADAQRKQQILLQQALPPGAPPSNILHGPAFIFPFNQQQAAAAAVAASVRPHAKSPNITPNSASVTASASASVNGSATAAPTAAAVSFNYSNLPSNETQYLAILQNNAYPFPIPAPTYRGTHPQAMPFFNGSFYTSQMIHPSQLQHSSSQPQQIQQGQQNNSISSGSSSSQKQHLQSQQPRPQGISTNGGNGTGNLNTFPAPKTRPTQSSQPHQARNIETEVGNEDSPSTADSRVSRGTMSVYSQNFAMPIHHQNFALVSSSPAFAGSSNGGNNQGENKKQQQHQQGLKGGVDSLPQTIAMSFASINGGTTAPAIDLSSVAQNHAVLQNFPDAARQSYHIIQAAAAAQAAQQRKNFRISEEGKNGGDSSNLDEEKKSITGKGSTPSGQSIVFSRPDLTDPSVSALQGTTVIDSSARNLNLVSPPQRGSRSSMPNAVGTVNPPNSQVQTQMQFQQQHMVQFQKQQQQLHQQQMAAARSKTPVSSNGSVYSDHLASSSPPGSKFPNTISGFPQNLVQTGGNSPSQSPHWKNSPRTTSQVQASTASSLKNHSQQQARIQQSHTQISFGSSQKSSTTPQGQQTQNTHQSSSPPMVVGSPTSSLSKGAGGSPRTTSSNSHVNKVAQPSSLSSQQSKNSAAVPGLKSPSILGNPHNITSSSTGTKSQIQQQQQLPKQMVNQPQLFFSPAYMQTQSPHSTVTTSASASSGFCIPRRYPEKQQQQGPSSTTSTGMLSLCPPVTLANSSTSDPKAVAASCNMKGSGLPSQNILHHPQFTAQSSGSFSYVHTVPAAVQVKPTEQKQPAER